MKNQIIGSILLLTFTLQIGCASMPKRAVPLSEIRFKEDENYSVRFQRSNQEYEFKAKGREIEIQKDRLLISTRKLGEKQAILNNEIQSIDGFKESGSHALLGMGIGAGSLALLGGIVAAAAQYDDSDLSELNTIYWISGIGGGAIVGGLIGLGIGAAIPKKSKITVTPLVSVKGPETRAGVGASLNF